jgi:hypothetical protein
LACGPQAKERKARQSCGFGLGLGLSLQVKRI